MPVPRGLRRPVAWLVHVFAVACMLVVAYLILIETADDNSWFTPEDPDGDPDGYAIAAYEAWLVVAPTLVIGYVVALLVVGVLRRQTARPRD